MALKGRKFSKSIRLKGSDEAATLDGEIRNDKTNKKTKVYHDTDGVDPAGERELITNNQTQTLENKTIDATAASGNNTLSADSADIVYDDTSEAVSSLGTDVQSALDAVKVALDNQNEASEIDYDNSTSGLAATDVQAAIDEVEGRVDTAETGLSDHIADAVDAHDASAISNVPTGNLVATDVQGALDELQSEIDALPSKTETLQNKTLDSTNTISGSIETPTRSDVKQDTEANLETYAASAADGQIVFATDSQKMFQIIDNELQSIGGGGATSFEIEQVAHGFAVGEGVYHNGTTWVKAQANDADTLAYFSIVEVIDVDNFIAADFGRIEVLAHGYTVGEFYFLSDSVAGQATNVEPSSFSNPLFYVEDANTLQVKVYRPSVVGVDLNMDGLSDVSASGIAADDYLKYNGSVYVPSKVTEQVISLTANEAIAIRDALYVNSAGEAAKVDSDDDDKIEFIGFARAAASATNPVEIVISGKLGGFSGLTAGEFVYADPSSPGSVVQPEPSQANVYLIKVGKAISATEILVNPDLAASAEFNREVVADLSITNNQAVATSIAGLSFDGSILRSVVLRYSIYRVTDSNEAAQTGQLRLTYKTNAASWSISDDYAGDDAGVTFSVDATGQILYASTDLAGASYSSNLKVNTVELFEI